MMHAVDMGFSITLPSEQRQEGPGGGLDTLFPRLRRETFLEFPGEFHESRGQADILVQRIPLIVARDDFRTPNVRHGGGNFIQTGVQEIGDDRFDGLPRKQRGQGMQTRGIVQIQANRVFLRRPQRRGLFVPEIEQGLEFHDYSAIPDYKDMRIIDRGVGSNMNAAAGGKGHGWAVGVK
jgi:hypothetical protein